MLFPLRLLRRFASQPWAVSEVQVAVVEVRLLVAIGYAIITTFVAGGVGEAGSSSPRAGRAASGGGEAGGHALFALTAVTGLPLGAQVGARASARGAAAAHSRREGVQVGEKRAESVVAGHGLNAVHDRGSRRCTTLHHRTYEYKRLCRLDLADDGQGRGEVLRDFRSNSDRLDVGRGEAEVLEVFRLGGLDDEAEKAVLLDMGGDNNDDIDEK